MSLPDLQGVLLIQCAVTCYMMGLIWFVQVVHYPLFARVGDQASVAYQGAHMRRTTWVTLPPMLVEAVVVLILLIPSEGHQPGWMEWVGALLLGVIWLSTFLIQVPCHEKLAVSFQAAVHRRLVATNWIRTLCWTLRAGLALAMMAV